VFDDINVSRNEMSGNIEVQDNTVVDDIAMRGNGELGNEPANIQVEGNTVDDDITISRNKVVDKVEIEENSVGGDLKCSDNDPAPTGDDNTVDGSATDQCSGL